MTSPIGQNQSADAYANQYIIYTCTGMYDIYCSIQACNPI